MKILAWLSMLLAMNIYAGEEWPQYLGPNRDGSVEAPGLFEGPVGLERLWISPLGSGFSGIVVGNGKVYAMHAAGEKDALSCFDAANGKKLWSFAYGKSFPKVGNSEAGPLSTPLLDGDRIFGVGASGEFFCLDANTGKQIWTRNLVSELGAIIPQTGITSSPVLAGAFLVLNLGDLKDKGVAAFHKTTGELAWHLGKEKTSLQSPSFVTLLGREQVVSLSETGMRGIDPTSGKVIWERDGQEWVQMYAIGDDLMLSAHFRGLVLHQISQVGGFFNIQEKWSNFELDLQYDMPVHHKGYLYGFRGHFLTCVKLATGEKVWSSWDAGNGMTLLADGHLAILSDDGIFRVVRAWEKGFNLRASVQVFEETGYTEPAYANGIFYMRNYTHLAAVKVK